MRIGIIGAGFTGLTSAWELLKCGHTVTIFEQHSIPGGLAMGFKEPSWQWSLEKHYHHIFSSDRDILTLADEIGHPFYYYRPNTSSFIAGESIQLDSPTKLLTFPQLSIAERLRMSAVLGYLKYVSRWQDLEAYTAHDWLIKRMGAHGYRLLWEPLLKSKFGSHFRDISLAWFWARIKARTARLGYPEGGFQSFAYRLAQAVEQKGATIVYDATVQKINQNGNGAFVVDRGDGTSAAKGATFDRMLITTPNSVIAHLVPALPQEYKKNLMSFEGIGAINMVLELSQSFLPNDVYWLNICDESYPFLALVEHTHFIDKKYYNHHHLLYIGNYLDRSHRYFSMSKQAILKEYHPYLAKINPHYASSIISSHIFKVPFAQPIVTTNYSQKVLPFKTPIKGLFISNMQQIYPWDRGTNYAVQWGRKLARACIKQ